MNSPENATQAPAPSDGPALPETCDLAIVGGGPGGSCMAALAAARGWQVVLLEKDAHPRFHIGESLLPLSLEIFEQLGVTEQVASIGVYKAGAEFVLEGEHAGVERIRFDQALNCRYPHAWQVRREELDSILFARARSAGATCLTRAKVLRIDLDAADGPCLSVQHGASTHALQARFVVDASGRHGVLSRQLGLRRANREHASAALYGHYEGVERRPGERAGDITICWFEHGWIWMIPLRDGVTSVGAVCEPAYLKGRKIPAEDFLWQTLQHNAHVARRMRDARLVMPVTATGNYSYQCSRIGGERWLLIGDAYAFVDPVFSSGVHLAMSSARAALPIVEAGLRGQPSKAMRRRYRRRLQRGIKLFSWFIYRFTTPTMRHLFHNRRNFLGVEQAIISVFAGDVYDNAAVRRRMRLFRLIYALTALSLGREAWRAHRRRLANARIRHEDPA